MIGHCPKCESEVLEGGTGYFCSERECVFKLSGVILGQVLNPNQAGKLLRNRRTDLLDNFVSKAGKTFSAFLVMDENGKVTFEFPPRELELRPESRGRDSQRKQSKREKGEECKPLLDAATKDLFRKNAFRITGLPVDTTPRQISKHERDVMVLVDVGQDPHSESAAFPMTPPPNQQDFRDAFQKLKDPEKRMVDEFFWFWPEEFGDSRSDPAIQALARGDSKTAMEIWVARESGKAESGEAFSITATHNLALVYHVCALDWENYAVKNELAAERRQKISDYWKGAFSRWERLATDESFWEKVTARIRQLNEPNLPTGFARRMCATLPDALDKINAELAVAFAESGKLELARLHIQFMRETHQGLDNVEKTAELVLMPAKNRLKEQIKRARDRADNNPHDAANAVRELLEQARSALALFELFFDKKSELRNELFDEIARSCNQLLVACQKATGNDKACFEILESILAFATSVELRRDIEKNIDTLRGNVALKELDPIYALLKKIQESKHPPSVRLGTIKFEVVPLVSEFIARLQGTAIPPPIGRSGRV